VCDGADNDCDDLIDDDDPGRIGGTMLYADVDGDGYGDPATPTMQCSPGLGAVANAEDCNDGDPLLFAGQTLTVSPVGGDWTTIQAAIAAACEGGTIPISGGLWAEQLDLLGKQLVVGGVDANNPVRLQAPTSPAISAINAEPPGTVIENLILSAPASGNGGGALLGPSADVTFRNVVFDHIVGADMGAGAYVDAATATFEDCTFQGGDATSSGGAIASTATSLVTVLNSSFDDNSAGVSGSAIFAVQTELIVVDSTFDNHLDNEVIYASGNGAEGTTLVGISMVNNKQPAWLAATNVFIDALDSRLTTGPLEIHGTVAPVTVDLQNSRLSGNSAALQSVQFRGNQMTLNVRNIEIFDNDTDGLALTDVFGANIENITIAGNSGHAINAIGGDATLTNVLMFDNGLAPDVSGEQSWVLGSTIDYSRFTDGAEATGWSATNTSGDPLLQTFNKNLPSEQWDLHPLPGGSARNQGNPGFTNTDGSRSDIGAKGGAIGDGFWYDDDDGDGLLDGWELQHFGSYTAKDGNGDSDADGRVDLDEFLMGSDPNLADTDGDGVDDGADSDALDDQV
jgi:predicted outer membrane repeat protein